MPSTEDTQRTSIPQPSTASSSTNPTTLAAPPPSGPTPHGAPVRQYLNGKITPHLVDGMKWLAVHEPEKPLKWLAEFLAKRSEEVEGTDMGGLLGRTGEH